MKDKRKYQLRYHLMPPSGWMNDPNGLCYFKGQYHVFFQYAPSGPEGKERYWGHYTSKDLIKWVFEGVAIKSDCDWDKSGAYSGCAFVENDMMELFYTGNVKHPGDHDYILSGREANVLVVKSEDGFAFGEKNRILTNKDYPDDYTCHVRDPRVWKHNSLYYMILGGRKIDNKGAVLQYVSIDKLHWKYDGQITTKEKFGYMWECPDVFTLNNQTVFMCCPQGLSREEDHFQNKYQSGYFLLGDRKMERLPGYCDSDMFQEWDMGFDFYAPQTMLDEKGRRILFGWAGVPDMEDEYDNKPIIEEGWQHSLTVPRELTLKENRILQYPIEEINLLRYDEVEWKNDNQLLNTTAFDMEIVFDQISELKSITIDQDIRVSWRDGICELEFLSESGRGRDCRRALIDHFSQVRILKDASMLEIYVNRGETVFTTRYFPQNVEQSNIIVHGAKTIRSWKMHDMEVSNRDE